MTEGTEGKPTGVTFRVDSIIKQDGNDNANVTWFVDGEETHRGRIVLPDRAADRVVAQQTYELKEAK